MNGSDLERVLAQVPHLTLHGLGAFDERRLSGPERAAAIASGQEDLRTRLDECLRAASWLQGAARTKSVNLRRTSYVYKHDAEQAAGAYVANGALIAAAIHLGFEVRQAPRNENAYLSISERWYQSDCVRCREGATTC